MPLPLEHYALIGDTHTAGLVGSDGSLDWLCLPRFDSGACFAALLGGPEDGRWLIAPTAAARSSRSYRDDTLVLETEFRTQTGTVRVMDCMPIRDGVPNVVRLVEGVSGKVEMQTELVIRFDYGSAVPWVRRVKGGHLAIAGPDSLLLQHEVDLHGEGEKSVAEFTVAEGDLVPFVLSWHPSHQRHHRPADGPRAVAATESWWREWSSHCTYEGPWREQVMRSLITLKALTYEPTGGIVAAPTTSLPEQLGGVRNWDYRFCWLRDATFTLYALMTSGYTDEAAAWRDWLLRAIAGRPEEMQIMYGAAGERRLPEIELDWLPGYEGAAPVRIGNAAARQHQLDVPGEVMDALHQSRRVGLESTADAWALQQALIGALEDRWRDPDEGIWEMRGSPRHFTHSKVMAWVAFDRAVRAVEDLGLDGPVQRWRETRDEIHAQVCSDGFDTDRNSFTQSYGSDSLDASLLMIVLVGFLEPGDARVAGTVKAIESELVVDGFVQRYSTKEARDGLPPGEGAFLPCSFWLADNLALLGRRDEAQALFERLIGLVNDVGLISEEYDPGARRLVGNFPQAFTHVGLVNTAWNLESVPHSAARHRSSR